jgi:hypothetical protein
MIGEPLRAAVRAVAPQISQYNIIPHQKLGRETLVYFLGTKSFVNFEESQVV